MVKVSRQFECVLHITKIKKLKSVSFNKNQPWNIKDESSQNSFINHMASIQTAAKFQLSLHLSA